MNRTTPYLFAADRWVGLEVLHRLTALGDPPTVLCTAQTATASHDRQLRAAFRESGGEHIIGGGELRDPHTLDWLRTLELDVAVSVQFPHLVRSDALGIPRRGWVNVHPAYLPYNRGWHTPSWAILDSTPAGVTIHEMVEEVDAGGIIAQREVPVEPSDTAHNLYRRLLAAEVDLLLEAWPTIRGPQPWDVVAPEGGTLHRKSDLFNASVQELSLDMFEHVGTLLDRLRALTTDRMEEAAWFAVGDRRFRVHVRIEEDR
jgi:methionyl-tRNA formyltransferase